MTSFQKVLKLNFLSGAIGTLVLTPFLYLLDAIQPGVLGGTSPRFGLVDIVMIIVVPLLTGVAFVIIGMIAFPIIRALQNRGVLKDVL